MRLRLVRADVATIDAAVARLTRAATITDAPAARSSSYGHADVSDVRDMVADLRAMARSFLR